MENKIEVIGIDHGWSGMKTVHEVFTSGCKEISTEPAFTGNLLEFGGKYYKIGSRRLEVKDTKVTDENYYMLTLAAVAKELKIRGRKVAATLQKKYMEQGYRTNVFLPPESYKDFNQWNVEMKKTWEQEKIKWECKIKCVSYW
ncbi:MAG: hypothetical protein HFH37_09595 [Lachnospiraceae bacterium]|nr:hypothetical protein [Lachnospiraceae bacterium]